jgi:hypothetical protein
MPQQTGHSRPITATDREYQCPSKFRFLVPPALGYLFALRADRQSREPAAVAETGAAGLPGSTGIA